MTSPTEPRALRLRRPERRQVTPVPLYRDALLPDEHRADDAYGLMRRLYFPAAVRMATQAQLTSLQAAVDAAASEGITYERRMYVGDWQLTFGPPRAAGQLPALYHALMKF